MVHLLPHWNFPERVGQNVPEYAYSTGDEVELFVNGVSQGRRKREPGLWRFVWNDVVYAPGAIRAVAYKGDKVWAEEEVRTAGPAARLALEPEKPAIAADGVELGYVTVKVCDAEGRLVPRACPQVAISVTGGGEFVAADNGDESDFTWFGAKERRAFNGLLSVIVRAKKDAVGPIEIKVESKGLEPATVMLKTKGK
jgi:beta-galactosidase